MKDFNMNNLKTLNSYELLTINGGSDGGSDLGNWLIDFVGDAICWTKGFLSEVATLQKEILEQGYGLNS